MKAKPEHISCSRKVNCHVVFLIKYRYLIITQLCAQAVQNRFIRMWQCEGKLALGKYIIHLQLL